MCPAYGGAILEVAAEIIVRQNSRASKRPWRQTAVRETAKRQTAVRRQGYGDRRGRYRRDENKPAAVIGEGRRHPGAGGKCLTSAPENPGAAMSFDNRDGPRPRTCWSEFDRPQVSNCRESAIGCTGARSIP